MEGTSRDHPVLLHTKPVSVNSGCSWSCPIELWISPKMEIWLLAKVEGGEGEIQISTQFPPCRFCLLLLMLSLFTSKKVWLCFSTLSHCIVVDSSKTSPKPSPESGQKKFPWPSLLCHELQTPDDPYCHAAVMFTICFSSLHTSCPVWEYYLAG